MGIIKKSHAAGLVIIIIILLVLIFSKTTGTKKEIVRSAVVAGSWYPGDKAALDSAINGYFNNSIDVSINGDVKALIVPHAGYVYSGQVASNGYNQLNKNYTKIIIIGTNHAQGAAVNGISIPNVTHYETPLGKVKVSDITDELLKNGLFVNVPAAHSTHIIEIQLPFLQKKLSDFEIIPLVTGALDQSQIQTAADILSKYIDSETLIVVSSDLSHYYSYDDAVKLDSSCIKSIEAMDFMQAANCKACSIYAVLILMELSQRNSWHGKILDYKNSGDTAGDKSRVVGYGSIAFYDAKEEILTKAEQEYLLATARRTLTEYLNTGKIENTDAAQFSSALKKVQGCFTTLNKDHYLRGCIGHILPQEELYKCVIDNAVNAAVHDPRFNPVTYEELEDIDIEISVLSVPQKLDFDSGDDLLNQLQPGIDGVVIQQGARQSTYLPQVWDNFRSKEEFLSSLCKKGGMAIDCWDNLSTQVYTYHAFVFSEST
ncbi:MAG: AmmeMemoRadiSam system protein B [Nanoarchaeota archaeon]